MTSKEKKPKLSPIQEMKSFRQLYKQILRCRHSMRDAVEKKERALAFANNSRFYDKCGIFEEHKSIIEAYKVVETEKYHENEYFVRCVPYIANLIERKQKIDELEKWTSANIKTVEKLLERDKGILRIKTSIMVKEKNRKEMDKVIKRLSKVKDEYDRGIPQKFNAQLKVKQYHVQIKFALNQRRLFYLELNNYAKDYLLNLWNLEPKLISTLLETYKEIQKFQKQIKTNKENMNRIIKVLELNLREGWLLCFREYDVQFFQTLKLRDRSMRQHKNPFYTYTTNIQGCEKEIWRYIKLFGDIRTELQVTGTISEPVTNIITNTIYRNGDLLFHFIRLKVSVQEQMLKVEDIKRKRLQVKKKQRIEIEMIKEVILDMEQTNKRLLKKLTDLKLKIHGNKILRETFYAYYKQLFHLISCAPDEVPTYPDMLNS
ncbi:uncharacterized protein isoform X2 [Rhodnius prolixus]|uniref:uncharacterized protein isoform X2 n=1 Tax=Rhodnius prolixus TaxID=13249 RepID=UPI003D18CACA